MTIEQKKRWFFRITTAVLLLAIFSVGLFTQSNDVTAQTGGNYDLSWFTVDTSAAVEGDNYRITASVGQADGSSVQSGGQFQLSVGFWQVRQLYPTAVSVAAVSATQPSPLYLLVGMMLVLLLTAVFFWQRAKRWREV